MSKKSDALFFQNFVEAADCACKSAQYLETCLENYSLENIKPMLEEMHQYEHAGDMKKHEMSAALAKAFVTPIDREDLAMISQCIDDISDGIEEVLQALYMYRIQKVNPDAVSFARKITAACNLLKDMLTEFVNFKKPEKLHKMIIELNNVEEECDAYYLEFVMKLSEHYDNTLDIISWRDIYGKMENCVDACEHVSDCLDTVAMKNT